MTAILNAATDAVTSYSSGPLSVASYHEIFIAINAPGLAYTGSTSVVVSRLDVLGALFPILSAPMQAGPQSIDIGPGTVNNVSVGDVIQIDYVVAVDSTATTTICVIGK